MENQETKYPDAKKHQIVSFIKSGIRLAGYCFIPFNLWVAAGLLFASEVVGVIEELVSFIKPAIRLAGYCFIPFNLWIAAGLLFASEVVGVIEELV